MARTLLDVASRMVFSCEVQEVDVPTKSETSPSMFVSNA